MKHVKTYEGFFSNLFTRKSGGIYHWSEAEMDALNANGFYQEDQLGKLRNYPPNVRSFYYESPRDNLRIILKKHAIGSNGIEDCFYEAIINTDDKSKTINKKHKTKIKTFDGFNKMLFFVLKQIPDIDLDTRKYNL